jgi:hypothetical protein
MHTLLTKVRARPPWIARLALVAVVACAGDAAAADPSLQSLPLDFSAPAACIDAATFRAHLLALPASPHKTEPPRAISVRVVEQQGTFAGELRIAHADGTTTVRQVTSAHCDEITEALEFVAALALGLDHAHGAAAAPPPNEPHEAARSEPAPVQARPRVRFIGAVYGGLVSNVGPRLDVAPSVAIGVMLDRPGLFAPEVALSGTWAASGAIATSLGSATLTLVDAALAGCPLRLALGAGLALRPCAELELGALTADATAPNLQGPSRQVRPWSAAAALARAEWQVGNYFMVAAEGGAVFPFLYDRFFFTPGTEVYSVTPVGAAVKLGAAVVLP